MKNDIGYGASNFHRKSSSNKAARHAYMAVTTGIDMHAREQVLDQVDTKGLVASALDSSNDILKSISLLLRGLTMGPHEIAASNINVLSRTMAGNLVSKFVKQSSSSSQYSILPYMAVPELNVSP
ncbi:hypothetical protein Tco_0505432 [Tanacetum coccineum]